ncbi:MAG: flap endonuclease [Candidatus Eiseniibacteriota bacterium]|nr:MAG: flap endonuclease [Candidatus Eisenbacteria bacterium]
MEVYLIDGTYELFRHFYALPSRVDEDGEEVGALLGVVASIISMIRRGTTHLGVATDHVVESFRNEMYGGYKTSAGIEPELLRQFHPLEEALRALGVVVWPMIEQEADDALAAAAARARGAPGVRRVLICSPDKDLAQCVRGDAVVQLDRRKRAIRNERGVWERFGVGPASIPDYLALVGDAADGFPGITGWGAKTTASVLARYPHLEAIPRDASEWDVSVQRRAGLAASLRERWDDALLFRELATLRTDADVFREVSELKWGGPTQDFPALCSRLRASELVGRAERVAVQLRADRG